MTWKRTARLLPAVAMVAIITVAGALPGGELTKAEMESYHRGVRDTAEAVARWADVGKCEALSAAAGDLARSEGIFERWFASRLSRRAPAGSRYGLVTEGISRAIAGGICF